MDYNDDSSSDVGPNQKQSISFDKDAPKAIHKLSDYTETVKVGENVTLKCQIENDTRKCNTHKKYKFYPYQRN